MENLKNKKMKVKRSKTTKKSVKGITLIALVITIIVLLILAGVTISMLTGDNGILKRANEAKEKTQLATEDEQRKMAMLEAAMNTENTEFQGVTIPAGFAPTRMPGESTVDEGLVITDSQGNEFVWVPVPKAIAEGDITESVSYLDGNNTPMAMKDGTSDITNYRGILYQNWTAPSGGLGNVEVIPSNDGLEEPIVVTYENNYDAVANNLEKAGITDGNKESFQKQMQDDYNEMVESVKKYGGFYVARYEMSSDGTNAKYQKGQESYYNNTKEIDHWYGYYKKQREFANNSAYGGSIKSSMIWGSQYDAMMNWMARNGIDIASNTLGSKINTARLTGIKEEDKLLNVYDLLGNSCEWTLEGVNNKYRTQRSGTYLDENSKSECVSGRNCNVPTWNAEHYCSRATLYIAN